MDVVRASQSPPKSNAVELPPPSAELVLWRVSMQAFIATAGRRRGEKFLRLVTEKLAHEENLSSVFNIRPTDDALKVREARKQAAVVFERMLPIFLAVLPDE